MEFATMPFVLIFLLLSQVQSPGKAPELDAEDESILEFDGVIEAYRAIPRATGRHFSKILSGLILGIGYLMAAFTGQKQALHDMMASCLVVNRSNRGANVALVVVILLVVAVAAVAVVLFLFPELADIVDEAW